MEYLILKYAHILAFVYWLGGDLGTFFGSKQVIRTDISPEARAIALKIMLACDQGPKIAMPLMLGVGFHMAVLSGLIVAAPAMLVLVWVLVVFWCANVNFLYFVTNKSLKARMANIDLIMRGFVVLAIFLLSGAALSGYDTALLRTDFVAYKLLIFAVMVCFGMLVRVFLKDFSPAFVNLQVKGASDETNRILTRSMKLAKPWVWGIWAGLFVASAIGTHIIQGSMVWVVLVSATPIPLFLSAKKRYG